MNNEEGVIDMNYIKVVKVAEDKDTLADGKFWIVFYKVYRGKKTYKMWLPKKEINLRTGELSGVAREVLGKRVRVSMV